MFIIHPASRTPPGQDGLLAPALEIKLPLALASGFGLRIMIGFSRIFAKALIFETISLS